MSNTTTSLEQALNSAAESLRSKMDANEYKNYLLGTVFYKYLSDNMLYNVLELMSDKPNGTLEEAQKIYEDKDNADHAELVKELRLSLGYIIEPAYTYNSILSEVNNHSFQVNQLGDAFNKLERSNSYFEGLFEDYDLYSKRLGSTPQKKRIQ